MPPRGRRRKGAWCTMTPLRVRDTCVVDTATWGGEAVGIVARHDDYALDRVPADARYPWFNVAVQRFGQLAGPHEFLLGATLGAG